jgi:hypothetical protein
MIFTTDGIASSAYYHLGILQFLKHPQDILKHPQDILKHPQDIAPAPIAHLIGIVPFLIPDTIQSGHNFKNSH